MQSSLNFKGGNVAMATLATLTFVSLFFVSANQVVKLTANQNAVKQVAAPIAAQTQQSTDTEDCKMIGNVCYSEHKTNQLGAVNVSAKSQLTSSAESSKKCDAKEYGEDFCDAMKKCAKDPIYTIKDDDSEKLKETRKLARLICYMNISQRQSKIALDNFKNNPNIVTKAKKRVDNIFSNNLSPYGSLYPNAIRVDTAVTRAATYASHNPAKKIEEVARSATLTIYNAVNAGGRYSSKLPCSTLKHSIDLTEHALKEVVPYATEKLITQIKQEYLTEESEVLYIVANILSNYAHNTEVLSPLDIAKKHKGEKTIKALQIIAKSFGEYNCGTGCKIDGVLGANTSEALIKLWKGDFFKLGRSSYENIPKALAVLAKRAENNTCNEDFLRELQTKQVASGACINPPNPRIGLATRCCIEDMYKTNGSWDEGYGWCEKATTWDDKCANDPTDSTCKAYCNGFYEDEIFKNKKPDWCANVKQTTPITDNADNTDVSTDTFQTSYDSCIRWATSLEDQKRCEEFLLSDEGWECSSNWGAGCSIEGNTYIERKNKEYEQSIASNFKDKQERQKALLEYQKCKVKGNATYRICYERAVGAVPTPTQEELDKWWNEQNKGIQCPDGTMLEDGRCVASTNPEQASNKPKESRRPELVVKKADYGLNYTNDEGVKSKDCNGPWSWLKPSCNVSDEDKKKQETYENVQKADDISDDKSLADKFGWDGTYKAENWNKVESVESLDTDIENVKREVNEAQKSFGSCRFGCKDEEVELDIAKIQLKRLNIKKGLLSGAITNEDAAKFYDDQIKKAEDTLRKAEEDRNSCFSEYTCGNERKNVQSAKAELDALRNARKATNATRTPVVQSGIDTPPAPDPDNPLKPNKIIVGTESFGGIGFVRNEEPPIKATARIKKSSNVEWKHYGWGDGYPENRTQCFDSGVGEWTCGEGECPPGKECFIYYKKVSTDNKERLDQYGCKHYRGNKYKCSSVPTQYYDMFGDAHNTKLQAENADRRIIDAETDSVKLLEKKVDKRKRMEDLATRVRAQEKATREAGYPVGQVGTGITQRAVKESGKIKPTNECFGGVIWGTKCFQTREDCNTYLKNQTLGWTSWCSTRSTTPSSEKSEAGVPDCASNPNLKECLHGEDSDTRKITAPTPKAPPSNDDTKPDAKTPPSKSGDSDSEVAKAKAAYEKKLREMERRYAADARARAEAQKKAQAEYNKKLAEIKKKNEDAKMKAMLQQMMKQQAAGQQTSNTGRAQQKQEPKAFYEPKCAITLSDADKKIKTGEEVTIRWSAEPTLVIKEVELKYHDAQHEVQEKKVSKDGSETLSPSKPGKYRFEVRVTGRFKKNCQDYVELTVEQGESTAATTTTQTTQVTQQANTPVRNVVTTVNEDQPENYSWFGSKPNAGVASFANIYATPNPMYAGGEQARLHWRGSGACSLSGPGLGGERDLEGTSGVTVTPELSRPGSYTYTLQCGNASSGIVVVVLNQPVYDDVRQETRGTLPPQVTERTTVNRCPVFTQYLKLGVISPQVQVAEEFLVRYGYFGGTPDTSFGTDTEDAVKRFQAAHADVILTPWGRTEPTGYWYKTSRSYANKLMGCTDPSFNPDLGDTL